MGSNLELYSTATHNSVLGFFAELCLLLGARKKLHIALSHGRRLLLLQYVLVVVKGGQLLAHLVF